MARVVVASKYQLLKKIGEGSFGKIFSAKTLDSENATDKTYAVKIMSIEHEAINKNEINIYEVLKTVKNIPSLYISGTEGKFSYIVMDLLEQSVEQLRLDYGDQLSLKVVIHLSIQMITIVEAIHERGIVHRDLKPANFLLKTNTQNISELYLIDFGLARCFLDEKSRHYTIKTNEEIVGTQRYMSINTHHGLTASRRDDLESIGYIMLFLYHGVLLWQNKKSMTTVVELKQKLDWTFNTLGEFVLFILYCRNLGFADKPNYDYLRNILTNLSKL
jgi:serine/threonine protein kinase